MTYQEIYNGIIYKPDQTIKIGAETIHSTHYTANVTLEALNYYRSVYPRKITQPMIANKNNLKKIYDYLYHE